MFYVRAVACHLEQFSDLDLGILAWICFACLWCLYDCPASGSADMKGEMDEESLLLGGISQNHEEKNKRRHLKVAAGVVASIALFSAGALSGAGIALHTQVSGNDGNRMRPNREMWLIIKDTQIIISSPSSRRSHPTAPFRILRKRLIFQWCHLHSLSCLKPLLRACLGFP